MTENIQRRQSTELANAVVMSDIAAQGDLLIVRVKGIPELLEVEPADKGRILAHSETGHHHVLVPSDAQQVVTLFRTADPLTSFMRITNTLEPTALARVVHNRDHDTHATLLVPAGDYMVRNQREYEPSGWRIAAD